jgi:hypothetical protein
MYVSEPSFPATRPRFGRSERLKNAGCVDIFVIRSFPGAQIVVVSGLHVHSCIPSFWECSFFVFTR